MGWGSEAFVIDSPQDFRRRADALRAAIRPRLTSMPGARFLMRLLRAPVVAFDWINRTPVTRDLHPADWATVQRLIET